MIYLQFNKGIVDVFLGSRQNQPGSRIVEVLGFKEVHGVIHRMGAQRLFPALQTGSEMLRVKRFVPFSFRRKTATGRARARQRIPWIMLG